ncbi:hypothetical protein Scep_024029 [Stephania cephalantha]|uniref:Uncharacterized protein n=1 Tax=Stephania cephalantha TaxID=152367 RepID=A0AAP0F4Q6_9MAGN
MRNAEKPPPLAVDEDEERSTKKVKNRENEETMTSNEGGVPKSFKSTLMEGEESMIIEMTNEKEIEVGLDDLSRSIKDNLTAIDFSDRVRKEMAEAMDNTIMVRLLGKMISFRTLENANSITVNMNASLSETASPESNDAAGPWIHASRHVRRTKTKITDTGDNKADSQGPSFHNKSRFEVLADENLENLSVNDSSKSKKYGEPNKEVSNGKLLLG